MSPFANQKGREKAKKVELSPPKAGYLIYEAPYRLFLPGTVQYLWFILNSERRKGPRVGMGVLYPAPHIINILHTAHVLL